MLKYLNHPNIVPILGVDINKFRLALGRMPGELDLLTYIKKPEADRLTLVRVCFVVIILRLVPPPAFRRCKGAQLPALPRRGPSRFRSSTQVLVQASPSC